MGQHKHNPNCQLAKEGKLPPKPKKMSKRERDRWLYNQMRYELYKPFIMADSQLRNYINNSLMR